MNRLILLLITIFCFFNIALAQDFNVADPDDGFPEIRGEWWNPDWLWAKCAYCRAKCCDKVTTTQTSVITEGPNAVLLMHWHECTYCVSKNCCNLAQGGGGGGNVATSTTLKTSVKPSVSIVLVTITSTCPTITPTSTITSYSTETITTTVDAPDETVTNWVRSTRTIHSTTTVTRWH